MRSLIISATILWCATVATAVRQRFDCGAPENPLRCAAILPAPQATDSLALTADTSSDFRAQAYYLDALRLEYADSLDAAYALFAHALAINPRHVGALYELAQFAQHMGDDSIATALMERAAAVDTANYWLARELVELYVNRGSDTLAIRTLEAMSHRYPRKSEIFARLVGMYESRKDYASAIRAIERYELLEGQSDALTLRKVRLLADCGELDLAVRKLDTLATAHPNDARFRVYQGDLYLQHDRPAQALDIYRAAEREEPNNVFLLASMANYYTVQAQADSLRATLTRLLTNPDLAAETRLQILHTVLTDDLRQHPDSSEAQGLLRCVTALPAAGLETLNLCASFMVTRGYAPDSVAPVLRRILAIDPEADMARNQLLAYAIKADSTADVERTCREAVDVGSRNPLYHYYLAVATFQRGDTTASLRAAESGIRCIAPESGIDLVAGLYGLAGDLYHLTGQDRRAYEAYDSCLLYDPDNALVLNNYAYYLSLSRRDLDRAADMAQRAVAKERGNATYLDTYAWVRFEQGRTHEARALIDSALAILADSLTADDASIVEHAGDIYARLGLTDQAVCHWARSLQLGGGERPGLIERKIRKRKYIAAPARR